MPKKDTGPETGENPPVVLVGKCGHVNKQHFNKDGVLEDLTCTLPADHPAVLIRTDTIKGADGALVSVPVHAQVHKAEYEHLVADIIPPLKQRVEGRPITYKVVKVIGEWMDAAGIPAPQQKPE